MNILVDLFVTFAKVGVMTFGGGYAMLPILQREVVDNKGWATEEELMDYFAIGQCTPGIIAVNTATFIGQKCTGVAGLPDYYFSAGGCDYGVFPPGLGAARFRRHPHLRVRADSERSGEAL